MPSVKLYKGSKASENGVSYNCASFDFENAVIDQDYYLFSNETGHFPATGETLKQIRFRITAAGINRLTDFDENPASDQNLVPPPAYDEGDGTESYPYGISGAKEVRKGEKPSDWEVHYMTKYFTKTVETTGYSYDNYITAGEWNNGQYKPFWRDNVQYYEVPNFAQIFYTDSTGFFGISRIVNVISGTEIQENIRVLYNRRPLASNSYFPDEFWWKSGGAFGQMLFYQNSLNYSKVVINAFSNQTNIIKDYQSRMLVQMIRFSYKNDTYIGVVVIKMSADGIPQEAEVTALTAPFWRGETTPAKGGAYSGSAGGSGYFQGTSNNRGDSDGLGIVARATVWNDSFAIARGGQNRYRIDDSGIMREIVDNLWNPSFWEAIHNEFFNPRDAVICCNIIPQKLAPSVYVGDPKARVEAAGRKLSETATSVFRDDYTWLHVGNIEVTEKHWYDGFPDFDNTAIYIHLPYVGTKQLDVEAVMEGELSVDYVCDLNTGDVIATVWTQDRFGNCNYRYEFKGNCVKEVLLAARNKTLITAIGQSVVRTSLEIGKTALAAAASGGIGAAGAAATSAAGFAEKAAPQTNLSKAASIGSGVLDVANHLVNSVSASSAGAGVLATNTSQGGITAPIDTQCYLIIARPKWSNPEHYGEQFGYPSDIGGTINDTPFEGFLSCRTIVLNGISATDVERSEIASYMVSGVFV